MIFIINDSFWLCFPTISSLLNWALLSSAILKCNFEIGNYPQIDHLECCMSNHAWNKVKSWELTRKSVTYAFLYVSLNHFLQWFIVSLNINWFPKPKSESQFRIFNFQLYIDIWKLNFWNGVQGKSQSSWNHELFKLNIHES